MDTKMSGIVAPTQTLGAAFLPKSSEQQSLAARFLGGVVTGNRGAGDETELGRKIIATHHGGEELGIDVSPVLNIIDVIFNRDGADIPSFMLGALTQSELIGAEEKVLHSAAALQDTVELPSRVISAIACEINCKCSTGVEVHTIVMEVLQLIKHYNWDSKALLALISFAIIFGEFRLEVQLSPTNPLAKAIAILKQIPEPKLDKLFNLISEIIHITKSIVEFYDLPRHEYFSEDSPEILATVTHIPTAVYWTIRSIVVSSTQILALTGMGIEYLTEPWELSSLADKLGNIKGHLVDIISRCYRFIEEKKEEESLLKPLRSSLESSDIDNMRSLKALFKHDQPTFYDCYNKKRVSIEDLRAKTVLLFVTNLYSELTVSDEYVILRQMCSEKRQNPTDPESQYEVVWVPVTGMWTEDNYRQFEAQREKMADFHTVHHPSVVSALVMRHIRQDWGFITKPLVVVMDTGGKIVHKDPIHMMRIWGSKAYPFTANREKSLWEKMSWTVELLAANLDPDMDIWVQEKRYICLYGGEDVEWIRKFTSTARAVALGSQISLEMLYTGKYNPKETLTKRLIASIRVEKLRKTLDWDRIRYFWHRLDRLWGSSKGTIAAPPGNEAKAKQIAKGVKDMVRYGRSRHGWAVIGGPEGVMAKGNGALMLAGLMGHMDWRAREAEIGFVPSLRERLRKIQPDEPNRFMTRLVIRSPEPMLAKVDCSECNQHIQMFTILPDTLSD